MRVGLPAPPLREDTQRLVLLGRATCSAFFVGFRNGLAKTGAAHKVRKEPFSVLPKLIFVELVQ